MTPPFWTVPMGVVIGTSIAVPICVLLNIAPGPATVIGMVTGAIGVLITIEWWERKQKE